MSTELAFLEVLGGFVLLIGGADVLVRFASRLGIHYGLKPVIVGATIVAFGTSSPEFMVSFLAGLRGNGGIALGNVIGSNVANIALVMGTAALLRPIPVTRRVLFVEYMAVVLSSVLLYLLCLDATLSRIDGLILCASFLLFTYVYLQRAIRGRTKRSELPEDPEVRPPTPHPLRWAVFCATGLTILLFGSNLVVDGATAIARNLELSDGIVGATLLALGTSLPELATVIIAALKRENDIAIGGVLGSNIFNILFVVGPTAAAAPLSVSADELDTLLPFMVGTTLLLFPLLRLGSRLRKPDGLLLLCVYGAFVFLCWRLRH